MSLVTGIMSIANLYKKELVGITKARVILHLNLGTYLLKGSSFLLWSTVDKKSYQGVPVKSGTIHLDFLASGNKGKGEAAELVNQLKANGEDIILMVRQDNLRGQAFYKKHGFVEARVVEYKNFNSIVMLWSAST